MKINTNKLDDYCKNLEKVPPAILIYGPDFGLVNERAKLIANSYFSKNNNSLSKLNIIDYDSNALINDIELLEIEAKSLSLLDSKKLIKIRDANDKIHDLIEKYLLSPEENSLIVLLAENLSPRSKIRQLFEKHVSAIIIPCYMDDLITIKMLIKNALNKSNIIIDNDAVDMFASYLGEDRQITISEIEKAILLSGKKNELTKEDILSYIEDSSSTSIDDLYDNSMLGNLEKSFRILFKIQSQGVNSIQIIRIFINQVHNLIALKNLASAHNINKAINDFKPPIFFKRKNKIRDHAKNLSELKISKVLNILNSAEIYCKTTKSSPNLILKQTILTINLLTKPKI